MPVNRSSFTPPLAAFRPETEEPERTYSMLLHLSQFLGWLIGPLSIAVTLVMWLAKKDQSQYIDDHGREAMNFTISIWIYTIIGIILAFFVVGICMIAALSVFEIVVVIMAAVRASSGGYYRYPMTIRFIPS